MPRQKKSTVPVLPPLEPWQEKMSAMVPLADRLAERVLSTLCIGAEPFAVEDATTFLYHRLMQTTHKPNPHPDDADDADTGNRMSASNDACLLIGFALGRRIGGGR